MKNKTSYACDQLKSFMKYFLCDKNLVKLHKMQQINKISHKTSHMTL